MGHRHGIGRRPRDDLQLNHEVRCGHPKGPVRQHRALGWYHHVPRNWRPNAEGDLGSRSPHNEDQDNRSSREEVLRLDRWIYPGLPVNLPADVDLKARILRVWTHYCPQKMLLIWPLE